MKFSEKLDPALKKFLEDIDALNLPPADKIPVEVSRDGYEKMSRLHGGIPTYTARIEDRVIGNDDNPSMNVRIYWPELGKKLPLLMYTHGGGWSRGSIDTHDALCRKLANQLGVIVVSPGYRRAPESLFPAGYNDVMFAYQWCKTNAESLGADSSRFAVAGDSAGGNLTAALVSTFIEKGETLPDFQLLIYPAMDMAFETNSVDTYDGYFLSKPGLNSYRDIYLPKDTSVTDYRVSPLYFDKLDKMCPTFVLSAGMDPLVDDAYAYVEKLKQAGVDVTHKVFDDTIHAYMHMFDLVPKQTQASLDWIQENVKKYWG